MGLRRKQRNKRTGRVIDSLCPGSMFLKSSERPAGRVLASRAGWGLVNSAQFLKSLEPLGKSSSLCPCGTKRQREEPRLPHSAVSSIYPAPAAGTALSGTNLCGLFIVHVRFCAFLVKRPARSLEEGRRGEGQPVCLLARTRCHVPWSLPELSTRHVLLHNEEPPGDPESDR